MPSSTSLIPADGETIQTPYRLTATFTEEFDPERSFVRVQDATGAVVAEGGVSPVGSVDDDRGAASTAARRIQGAMADSHRRRQRPRERHVHVQCRGFAHSSAHAVPSANRAARRDRDTCSAGHGHTRTDSDSPTPTASPTGSNGSSTGGSNDVLIALAVGVAIIGVLALLPGSQITTLTLATLRGPGRADLRSRRHAR